MLRMGMEDDRHWGGRSPGMVVSRLDPSLWPVDDYVRHDQPTSISERRTWTLAALLALDSPQFLIIFVGQLYVLLSQPVMRRGDTRHQG